MTRFVGLDVSQKMSAVCVVDDTGRRMVPVRSRQVVSHRARALLGADSTHHAAFWTTP